MNKQAAFFFAVGGACLIGAVAYTAQTREAAKTMARRPIRYVADASKVVTVKVLDGWVGTAIELDSMDKVVIQPDLNQKYRWVSDYDITPVGATGPQEPPVVNACGIGRIPLEIANPIYHSQYLSPTHKKGALLVNVGGSIAGYACRESWPADTLLNAGPATTVRLGINSNQFLAGRDGSTKASVTRLKAVY